MNAKLKLHLLYGFFGLFMGVVLSSVGFTDYTEVHRMFIFADFRLLFMFAATVGLTMVAFLMLGRNTSIAKKTYNKGTVPGSILFGAGWAITGACPSIALVQLGEGKFVALFTIMGILAGVWGYRKMAAGSMRFDTGVCGEA